LELSHYADHSESCYQLIFDSVFYIWGYGHRGVKHWHVFRHVRWSKQPASPRAPPKRGSAAAAGYCAPVMRAQAERLATTSFTSATSVSTSVSATVSSVTRVTAVTTVTTVTSVSATVTSVTNVTSVTATVGGDVVVAVEHHPAQRRAQNRLGLAEPGYARPARGPRAARALAAARGRVAVEQRGHADERNCQSHRADSR